ncbi:MAG: ATP--guanido phosphotransferase [Phycisphaerales bacterium]|jgi:protein arginine kinase|nr:ATP--guanido phosphotransferase [Phycisphaerales bacterium]MBT7170312.1 ATP--guanido phosphotransferase [Phycisphaerales bacterium]
MPERDDMGFHEGDVVVSSRVRLARNLASLPFVSRCEPAQCSRIVERIHGAIEESTFGPEMEFIHVASLTDEDAELLVEQHLVSRELVGVDHACGAAISKARDVSIMINEEDHLRLQALGQGQVVREVFDRISAIDDELAGKLDFSFHEQYGYLTACPTNVGTALRVSVMLHLPCLRLTGELDKALSACRDMRMAIRGMFGEGTEAAGDIYQISNQITLGKSEGQIVDEFLSVINEVIAYERTCRETIGRDWPLDLEDRFLRSQAVLRVAKKMSTSEAMFHLSIMRLAALLGRLECMDLPAIGGLMREICPAHLQLRMGGELSRRDRDIRRAELLRKTFGAE